MPITRTPIVDDDGTGTTGTILNNAWKQELYGQIDALSAAGNGLIIPPYRVPSALTFTMAVAQYDNFAPPGSTTNVVWALNSSVASMITGIPAEAAGTLHLLINTANNTITLKNQHTSSTAGNRFICPGLVDTVLTPWYTSVWVYYLATAAAWMPIKI